MRRPVTKAIYVFVGQIALANSARDYEQRDLDFVSRMATHYALALERQRMEEDLQVAHGRLQGWVQELEERGLEMARLNEMGNLLQTCQSIKEAYIVIEQFTASFFPETSGVIYSFNARSGLYESAIEWGDELGVEGIFSPNDCWALRRGLPHVVEDTSSGLLCLHLGANLPQGYLCVPMVAQGETLGLLHLQCKPGDSSGAICASETARHHRQELALSFAGHIALALANLKLSETLHDQVVRDPLTGVFNRRFMEETLARELHKAKRGRIPLSVIMLDLDHFKDFNDEFGHEAGDVMLQEMAHFLKRHFRAEDVVCRYGGEEFVVILPGASLEESRRRAEELCGELRNFTVSFHGQELGPVTISEGLAVYPEHGGAGDERVQAADRALYDAKRAGRDRLVIAA